MPSPRTKPRGSQVLVQAPVWRGDGVLRRRQGPPRQHVFMTSIASGGVFSLFHEDPGSPRGLASLGAPACLLFGEQQESAGL